MLALAPAGASAHGLVTSLTAHQAQPVTVAGTGVQLKQMSVALDGTGGLVYLAQVNGAEHVFVVRITRGVYSAPVELDTNLSGTPSSPSIAASLGGELLVTFAETAGNTGTSSVYTSYALSTDDALSPPALLVAGASSPSVSINVYGQGYLALTKTFSTGGNDVYAYYWDGSTNWYDTSTSCNGSASEPFNATPLDDAGTGTGRPVVYANHDGEAVVAWGEGGHVYSRRVVGSCIGTTSATGVAEPKVDDLASYTSSAGTQWTELSATAPQVAGDGDSTWENISFQETFTSGSGAAKKTETGTVEAVDYSVYAPVLTLIDGLGVNGVANTVGSQIAVNEMDSGAAIDVASTGAIDVSLLPEQTPGDATPNTPSAIATETLARLYSGSDNAYTFDPDDVSVIGTGNDSSMVAWIGSDTAGKPAVLEAYAPSLSLGFNAAMTLASDGVGAAIEPTAGVLTGSDYAGDGLVAWLQGGQLHLGAASVAPYAPGLAAMSDLTTRSLPTLSWSAAYELFGSVTYTVVLDGKTLASTTSTSVKLAGPLRAGGHTWSVTATNSAGQSVTATRSFTVTKYVAPKPSTRSQKQSTAKPKSKAKSKPKSAAKQKTKAKAVKHATVKR